MCADQADAEAAAAVGHMLEGPMRAHGLRRTAGGGAAFVVLRILLGTARGQGRRWGCFDFDLAEGTSRVRLRSYRPGACGRRGVGAGGPEDEDGHEPDQDGGREDDHRTRWRRVERAIEEKAESIDHRTAPLLASPTPGGWA
jgi:hypothetical protein